MIDKEYIGTLLNELLTNFNKSWTTDIMLHSVTTIHYIVINKTKGLKPSELQDIFMKILIGEFELKSLCTAEIVKVIMKYYNENKQQKIFENNNNDIQRKKIDMIKNFSLDNNSICAKAVVQRFIDKDYSVDFRTYVEMNYFVRLTD